MRVTMVEVKSPPTTTVARGLWISAPGPLTNSKGMMPKIVVNVVIKTGLSFVLTPWMIASFIEFPCLRSR